MKRKTTAQPSNADPYRDSIRCAEQVGLRYVYDTSSGIRRVRRGRGFVYVDESGRAIRVAAQLARIRALVIPPAWRDVWICPNPNGHLQATGRDVRGRKQYRYHSRYRAVRDETKYDRMIDFGKALPALRRHVQRDLHLHGLPRGKVLATVVRLLEITGARVGNTEYAHANGSYGLTTLRNRHVAVGRQTIHLAFRGKSGKDICLDVNDRRLANIVSSCRDLPGHELFQYVDDEGRRRPIDSADVNGYLRGIMAEDYTAKDFRTWAGTMLAVRALRELGPCPETKTGANRSVAAAIDRVAAELTNTRAVCRKCYVHPAVIEAYLEGTLFRGSQGSVMRARSAPRYGLDREEKFLLAFLRTEKRSTRHKSAKNAGV